MYAVPNRSAATLMPIIQNLILPGTTVMSDLWRAYGGIAMGFNHFTVNSCLKRGRIFLGGNCPEGSCPGGGADFPRWELSRGELSGGGGGGFSSGGIFLSP